MVIPGAAFAHSPIQGLTSFYNGMLHPLLVPAHLLSVVALGFLFGQRGANVMQTAIILFLVAMVVGLLGAGYGVVLSVETTLLALAMLLGVLVALSLQMPIPVYWLLAVVTGFLLGIDSVQDAYTGKQKLGALVGSGTAIYLGLLYATVLAQAFQKRDWQKIAIRVVGSWIAASAMLVLALILSGAGGMTGGANVDSGVE
jgi:urease accessory protein